MDRILKAKHWQIFLIIIIGFFISNFTVEDNTTLTLILKISGVIIYFLYPFLIGLFLYDYIPEKIKLNHIFFLINSYIWIGVYIFAMITSDGESTTLTGFAALPGFYIVFAFLHFLSFPVKLLKSIEINREARFSEYKGYLLLILFFPIGIWFLQPRINRAVELRIYDGDI